MLSYLLSDNIVLNSDNVLDSCSTLANMIDFGFNAPVDSTVKILSLSLSDSISVATFDEFHFACSTPFPNLACASNFND